MKYYILDPSEEQLTKGIVANFPEGSEWIELPWLEGEKINLKFPTPLEYRLTMQSQTKKYNIETLNYIATGIGQILADELFSKVVSSLTTHYDKYSSNVIYNGLPLKGLYFTINLTASYPVINLFQSDYKTLDINNKNEIILMNKLVLSQKKLNNISPVEHIFRLKEYSAIILISEFGKSLLEENNIQGVSFRELDISE